MPFRGSVDLLFQSIRPRTMVKAGLGAGAAFAILLGTAEMRDAWPVLNQDGLAQTLRQSAWDQALTGQSAPDHWPWEDVSANLSLAPSAKVRRLGLSAAMRDPSAVSAAPKQTAKGQPNNNKAINGPIEGDIALGNIGSGTVGIGDRITFTANDGATCIYHVTGRPVVDPHLASDEAGDAAGESGLFECGPLESLIMQADQDAAAAMAADDQRNL